MANGPDFSTFGPNLGPTLFFSRILPLLDARHCCSLSLYATARKTNEPNLRKWQKKPRFGPVFGTFGPNFGPKNFFRRFYTTRCLTLLQPVIYAVSRTANEPDLRQWKNPNFEPNFGPFWAKFGPRKFFHGYFLN